MRPRVAAYGARAVLFLWVGFWAVVASSRGAQAQSAGASEQPRKAALMIVIAHPDDEAYFPGLIPYACLVRRVPVVLIVMTSGEAGISPPGDRSVREREMCLACRDYGMPNPPLFARFADGALQGTLEDNWKLWGGEDRAAAYLADQIRRYRPEVVVTHALDGEYGHPNHVGTALSTTKAFAWASDPTAYPVKAGGPPPWAPAKLYVHRWPTRPTDIRWDVPIAAMNGLSCLELGNRGGRRHVSQGYAEKDFAELDGDHSTRFGLYATRVGPDRAGGDLFENVSPDAVRRVP